MVVNHLSLPIFLAKLKIGLILGTFFFSFILYTVFFVLSHNII